ncbi:unnamed protein product [Adineta ricciae]|uniref:Glycolipid transfer protein domain-containing protein n=1 Tax=Adineta ricciae TaxID=249248 RepID=A0A814HC26_ADIRI|nr:unnamed protein product [Adineta ricciae]CAF1007723.1 unnamed protein product [Adineta ricciae]
MASAPITENCVDTNSTSTAENQTVHQIRQFDLKVVRDAFVDCIQPDQNLLLHEYVRAYDELCVFVSSLGAIFDWAIKDLTHKLVILREHQRLDPINYHSIQSMIAHEVKTDRVKTKDTALTLPSGKPLPNGSRTLLRLHRALAFISSFLSQMRLASDNESSAAIAWNAYSSTLGHFHSWPVRHTIHAAIKLTVPDRGTLIDKLLNKRNPDEIETISIDIVESCNLIESKTQELFEKHHLTRLP